MRGVSGLGVVVTAFAVWFFGGLVLDADFSDHRTPVNGTILSLSEYPQRYRDGVAATHTDPYRTPRTVTGRVMWNPANEVCVRFDAGGEGCWYVIYEDEWEPLQVGQHVERIEVCAPHPTRSSWATDVRCPAFSDADWDRVVVGAGLEAEG